MSSDWPTFEEWFAALPADAQARTRVLADQFRRLGVDDPEGWARSEISEDIAQLTRVLVLRRVRSDALEKWRRTGELDNIARYDQDFHLLLTQLRASGVEDEVITSFAQKVAAKTAWDIVHIIDEGHDPDAPSEMPTWSLEEGDSQGVLTGRNVGGLHESLYEFDPTRSKSKDQDV
jgi:hypothetical protein